jgi:hypothetical protein
MRRLPSYYGPPGSPGPWDLSKTVFKYKIAGDLTYYISRWQLPLVPAYAFTANKIQGQSLEHALVDLKSAKGTLALYVMSNSVGKFGNTSLVPVHKCKSPFI